MSSAVSAPEHAPSHGKGVEALPVASQEDVWELIIHRNASGLKAVLASSPKAALLVGGGDQSALHLACECDSPECVQLLVDAGAEINAEDSALRTPLLVACESNSTAAAQILIVAGASVKVSDENGMTPLHWLARHGAADALGHALTAGAEVDAVSSSSQTALHEAISRSNLACALVLLDAGASPTATDDEKRNALHLAMQFSGGSGNCSEATLLLLRLLQLKPEAIVCEDADRRTPLHWACVKNALPCVKALLGAGAKHSAVDWAGRTPLHWAILVDATESAAELLKAGAEVGPFDRDKRTPLHWAADRSSEGCVKMLLQQDASNVDAVDWGGYCALHYAARRGAAGCVRALLAAGAERRLVAMKGETPADVATDPVTKALLLPKMDGVSMKRSASSMSLSSGNSLVILGVLPNLATQFYEALWEGERQKVEPLLSASLPPAATAKISAALAAAAARKDKELGRIDSMCVCSEKSKMAVELTVGGDKVLHSITFDSDGLIADFVPWVQQA